MTSQEDPTTIAFFDIDKTILTVNSAKLWVRYELERGTISKRDALRGFFWMGLYGVGVSRIEHVLRSVVRDLRGRAEQPIREDVARFYEEYIAHTIRPGALEAVRKHQEQGDKVILLTSSSNYIAELVNAQLQCDGFASNQFEVDEQGLFTGEPVSPLCFGAGKIHYAREFATLYKTSLRHAYFYTDSYSDLPLLKLARFPRVVHPDPRLAKEAIRQQWPVLDWN